MRKFPGPEVTAATVCFVSISGFVTQIWLVVVITDFCTVTTVFALWLQIKIDNQSGEICSYSAEIYKYQHQQIKFELQKRIYYIRIISIKFACV